MDSAALVEYEGNLEKAIEEGIRLIGGFGTLYSPIIIKPNICIGVDKTGFANTRVEMVEALIKLVFREDKKLSVRIVESDSESKFADEAFEKFGYKDLAERLTDSGFDVSLINLSQEPTVKVRLNGLYFKDPELPKLLTETGYFVSLAVAKTHGLTLITGVLKNLFGLLPRKDQSYYHPQINEVIVDINRLVRSDLCIVDGIIGLEGWGGLNPRPVLRNVNTLILGRKPVSVDAIMARIMGFSPETIRHLVEATKYDLGSLHPKVLGEDLESMMVKFDRPSSLRPTAIID